MLLFFFFFFSLFSTFCVYRHEFEMFVDFKLRTSFHHRVTHNNTHAYTFINTSEMPRDATQWQTLIDFNFAEWWWWWWRRWKRKHCAWTVSVWNGDYITRLKNSLFIFFAPHLCFAHRKRRERNPKPPKTFFFRGIESCNFHRMLLNGRTWYIDEIRFKTKMKIESDLWKWKLNSVHIALVKINRCIASASADVVCVCVASQNRNQIILQRV